MTSFGTRSQGIIMLLSEAGKGRPETWLFRAQFHGDMPSDRVPYEATYRVCETAVRESRYDGERDKARPLRGRSC